MNSQAMYESYYKALACGQIPQNQSSIERPLGEIISKYLKTTHSDESGSRTSQKWQTNISYNDSSVKKRVSEEAEGTFNV